MNDLQRYLVEEFAEDYQEGRMSRREALKLIASVLGSMVLAQSFIAACAPPPAAPSATLPSMVPPTLENTAAPQATATDTVAPQPTAPESTATATTAPAASVSGTVSPDDPAVVAGAVEFPGDGATLLGYLARPAAEGQYPVILVCHENRGLTPHIQDVTRRLAKAGYVGLAVDLLSRQGGSDVVGSGNAPGALGNIPEAQLVQDFVSGWQYVRAQPFADPDRVGMVGFCFGGGVTWRVAAGMPELKAAVPFYGPPVAAAQVPGINAAVLAIYGERDQRINQTIPTIEAAMQQNSKTYEKVIYTGADHAFHNDTGSRYDADAARDAWARTLEWFRLYVAAP